MRLTSPSTSGRAGILQRCVVVWRRKGFPRRHSTKKGLPVPRKRGPRPSDEGVTVLAARGYHTWETGPPSLWNRGTRHSEGEGMRPPRDKQRVPVRRIWGTTRHPHWVPQSLGNWEPVPGKRGARSSVLGARLSENCPPSLGKWKALPRHMGGRPRVGDTRSWEKGHPSLGKGILIPRRRGTRPSGQGYIFLAGIRGIRGIYNPPSHEGATPVHVDRNWAPVPR